MVQEKLPARPSASQVVAKIIDAKTDERCFCFSCLEFDPSGGTCEPADIATGSLVRDLHRDHIFDPSDSSAEDKVTEQLLEELGAITVTDKSESIANAADDAISDIDAGPEDSTEERLASGSEGLEDEQPEQQP